MSSSNDYHLADRRMKEWFSREQARREGQAHDQRPHAPLAITISRQFGAGGHTVASALAQRLGTPWEVWDRDIIEKVAASANAQTDMVRSMDEHSRTWVDEVIRISVGLGIMEQATFRKHLALVLAALAQQGHVITVGRGANFILPTALNIRLIANLETRAQTIMRQESVEHAVALKRIQIVDKERAAYTKTCFGREINDATAYSMVLSTSDLGIPATIEAIVAVAAVRFDKIASPHAT